MRKKVGVCIIFAALLGLLTGCGNNASGGTPSTADSVAYKWDWMKASALNHPMSVIGAQFAEEVAKATNGRLSLTLRAMGELPFKNDEYIRVVGDNSVAMADADVGATGSDLKSGAMPAWPFLVGSFQELAAVVDILRDHINQEMGVYGARLLMYASYPVQNIWGSGEPPKSMGSLSRKKIRAQSLEQSQVLLNNNISPVSIASQELATSMSRGVANGLITAALTMTGNKWYEFCKWGYMLEFQVMPCYVVVSRKFLDELPEDIRATLLKIADTYEKDKFPTEMTRYEEEARKQLSGELGLQLISVSEEERSAQMKMIVEYWDKWAAAKGSYTPADLAMIRKALNK
jgi:TRAP-type C4-dicarboxylate transport system substrate-binding protein